MGFINTKVGEFSLGEAFGIGIAKVVGEQLLNPVIGNGTFMSGAIKLAGAWGLPKVAGSNMATRIIATGLAVDGVEDVLTRFFAGGLSMGGATTQQSQTLVI